MKRQPLWEHCSSAWHVPQQLAYQPVNVSLNPKNFWARRITDHTPGEVSRPSVPNLQMRCANSPLDRYVLTVTVELEGSGAEGAHEER